MSVIRDFTNTKCELEMTKVRLNILLDKKSEIYCRYFPITPTLREDVVTGGRHDADDKMVDYLHELHEIDIGTGLSLADEIIKKQDEINKLQNCIDIMSETLSKMTGIESQLYYEIVVKGIRITKAVENIAEKNEIDTSTIWRHYYKKIKQEINKLKKIKEIN